MSHQKSDADLLYEIKALALENSQLKASLAEAIEVIKAYAEPVNYGYTTYDIFATLKDDCSFIKINDQFKGDFGGALRFRPRVLLPFDERRGCNHPSPRGTNLEAS